MRNRNATFHLIGRTHTEPIASLLVQLFGFEGDYQIGRLAEYIKSLAGQKFTASFKAEKQKKTRTSLGFYFGAIVPATALELKELYYEPTYIRENWREYVKQKKVTPALLETADTMLRLEFFYEYARTIKGDMVRIPKELKDKDNPELLEFIDKIMNWRMENQLQFLDIDAYKASQNMPRLLNE